MSRASSSGSLYSLSGRKRGRPPTTGEYVGLADAKRAFVEARKEELALKTLEARLEKSRVGQSARDKLPRKDDLAAEARERPSCDLAAEILEEMDAVDKVATTSNNLKGGYVRLLRLAARKVPAMVSELAQRASAPAEAAAEELGRLRLRVNDLETELATLKAEYKALREAQRRPASPPVMRHGRVLRKVRRAFDSDDDDEEMRGDMTPVELDSAESDFLAGLSSREPSPPPPPRPKVAERSASAVRRGGFGAFKVPRTPPPPSAVVRKEAAAGKKPPAAAKKGGKKSGEAKAPPPIQPPVDPPAGPTGETWAVVAGRKKGKKKGEKAPPTSKPSSSPQEAKKRDGEGKPPPPRKAKAKRPPSTAAVALTIPPGVEGITYKEVMLKARAAFNPVELGIPEVRPKQAITGGLLLEIPGEGRVEKAAALASRLSQVLGGTGVRVSQPSKRAEMRVRGLEQSITPEEVVSAVVLATWCLPEEVKTGVIRPSPSGRGLGSLWVQAPLAAIRKITSAGKLRVGWGPVPVDFLPPRPLQCFRCLEKGHVRSTCPCTEDRGGSCYRCGEVGHLAANCQRPLRCTLCAAKGKPANHRAGSGACPLPPTRGRRRAAVAAGASAPPAAGVGGGGGDRQQPMEV